MADMLLAYHFFSRRKEPFDWNGNSSSSAGNRSETHILYLGGQYQAFVFTVLHGSHASSVFSISYFRLKLKNK